MATPIRMKNKSMNRIHLGPSGAMEILVVKAASDAPSKGASAQPAGPLTTQESTGLTSGPKTPLGTEEGTGNTLQGPTLIATSVGPMATMEQDMTEGLGEKQVTESAPIPSALGETVPVAPTIEDAKDPNAQKEATVVAPNTGAGKIVGETLTK